MDHWLPMSVLAFASLFSLSVDLCAADGQDGASGKVDFNHQIRPLLSNRCFACHGPDQDERKADLRLDTFEGATADLDGTFAIVPNKPEESEILVRLLSHDKDEVMPPPKKGDPLSAEEIGMIRRWIEQGAKYEIHWSYVTPQKAIVPEISDARAQWPVNEVDRFLLARIEKEGLQPSAEADRQTLARRLSLDLIGLPSAWDEVENFVKDQRPDAYERYVAQLLANPAYGEHWGGLWLDLARYADSSGYPSDQPREIWGYRDWVIAAYNRNLPFDQFTIEQIAGDLLPDRTEDQLIATAFHRNTMTQNEGGTSDEEFRVAAVIDRVNTTMSVWMGTTMSCAQCHTHKSDPLTQNEYFSLFSILNQSADADKKDESPVASYTTPQHRAKQMQLSDEITSLEKQITAPKDFEKNEGFIAWEKRFSQPVEWMQSSPHQSETDIQGGATTIEGDGFVSIDSNAETATHTVEIPLAAGDLQAIRLETRPAKGFGNFVLTALRATLIPPSASQGRAEARAQGRYVRIELPGKAKFLHLAEVEVYQGEKNIALQGKAVQSSQYSDAAATRAVDGKTDGDYTKGSVSHSNKEDDPWWEVDLGSEQPIDTVVVWNRTDGGNAARLAGYRVSVLDARHHVIWKEENLPAAEEKAEFAITGDRMLSFASAKADYEQSGFPAASLVDAPTAPDEKHPGWAVAGAQGKPHELILSVANRVTVVEGTRLRVVLEQKSRYAQHLIGSFRLSTSTDARFSEWQAMPSEIAAIVTKSGSDRDSVEKGVLFDYYLRNLAPETKAMRDQWKAKKAELAALPTTTVPIMQELPAHEHRETRVQIRGNWQNLGDKVGPGTPAAFHPLAKGSKPDRLGLAKWLVSRDNPLTARVIVNRYWETLFGVGIVATSEEFGSQGETPFHPQLLDWLAVDFMEHGWDTKRLLTQLVTTRAYRQISKITPDLQEVDPENRLLARGPRIRPQGEMLRDQALAVGGLLSSKIGGPPVRPIAPNLGLTTAFGRSNDWVVSEGEDRHRRSLYTEVRRNSPYPSFTTFDATNREVCTLRRNRTNTPLQAFVTLNDPVFIEANQAFARRILSECASADTAEKVRRAYRIALSRDASAKEVATLAQLHEQALAEFREDGEAAIALATEPLGAAPEGSDIADLAAWTAVANVIMNLDEFLIRR